MTAMTASLMDERSLVLLRRQLEALNYTDRLEPASAPLVAKLVEDLVRTTDSYRSVKLQSGKYAQEISTFNTKLDVVRQDCSRLAAENSALHAQLIQAGERHEAQQREGYAATKRLEGRLADLSYWKTQAVGRQDALEKENAALKRRVAELLKAGERRKAAGHEPLDDDLRITLPKAISGGPARRGRPSPAMLDLQRSLDARIASLQRQLDQRSSQVTDLTAALEAARRGINVRDSEISRLGAKGPGQPGPAERAAMERRAEAGDEIVLALNKQIDGMSAELDRLRREAADAGKLQTALAASEQARAEAEERLGAALRESAGISQDAVRLKGELARLEVAQARAGAAAGREVDSAIAAATEVNEQLHKARDEAARLKAELATAVADRDEARARAARLASEAEHLQFLVDEAHAGREATRESAAAAANKKRGGDKEGDVAKGDVEALRDSVGRLKLEAADGAAAREALTLARDTAERRAADLSARLEAEQTDTAKAHAALAALERRLSEAEDARRRAEAGAAAAEARAEELQRQLRESNHARLEARAGLDATGTAHAHLAAQAEALLGQLRREQGRCEELAARAAAAEEERARVARELKEARDQCDTLEQRLKDDSALLAAAAAAAAAHETERASLLGVQGALEESEREARELGERLKAAEAESARLRASAAVHRTTTSETARISELQRLIDDLSAARESDAAALSDARRDASAAASARARAEQERERAAAALRAAEAELEGLRAAADEEGVTAAAAGAREKGLRARVMALQQQLEERDGEVDRLQGLMAAAEDAARAARQREDAARAQGREFAERARRAETLCEEAEAELSQVRAQLESSQAAASEARAARAEAAAQLAAKDAAVEALTTLSLRGDATVQEYMGSVKTLASDLRAAQLKLSDAEGRLQQREEELQAAAAEARELRRALRGADSDRDTLQAAVDAREERLAAADADLAAAAAAADERARALAAAEGRVVAADARCRELSAEVANLQAQLAGALSQLGGSEGDRGAMREELRALGEDMEALVRENQVVSSELAAMQQQCSALSGDLAATQRRAAASDAAARAKDAELEDMRSAYEALATEHRRAQAAVLQLEREAALREAALASAGEEAASLREAARAAQMAANQYLLDLQAYERQMDHLSRQRNRDVAEGEEVARQRELLLTELRSAQQVRLDLERSREDQQRHLAALDAQLGMAQARLVDAESESSSLAMRLEVERGRVAELEGLLATMRAREFRAESDGQRAGGALGAARERNRMLEAQVATLQQQVAALQRSRETQDAELSRLRRDALELAAAHAAATGAVSGGGGGGGGGTGWSTGGGGGAAAAAAAARDGGGGGDGSPARGGGVTPAPSVASAPGGGSGYGGPGSAGGPMT